MSSSTETWLAALEAESKALKKVFDRAATTMPVYSKTASITTTKNSITLNFPGSPPSTFEDQERIVVTFNSSTGANTIAKLEMTCSSTFMPIKRQNTFSGGAQWIVTNTPSRDGSNNWIPTTYTFTVQSLVDGTLTLSEATS